MVSSCKWILLLALASVSAQDPRKRVNTLVSYEDVLDDVSCSAKTCLKRSPGQDEFGPFWANRGKKDPTYTQNKLFAEEPHWILVRRDENVVENEPFYVTRGKKNADDGDFWRSLAANTRLRSKRNYAKDEDDTPFFAARGKKRHAKTDNY